MSKSFHPFVKAVLDGERASRDLPPELHGELEEARQLLAAVSRREVVLSPAVDARVMSAVRKRARSPRVRAWHWLTAPSVPPWAAGALAAAAALVLFLVRVPPGSPPGESHVVPDSVYVKFVLFAPAAHQVAVAGTFNRWDPSATPLASAGEGGVWTVTLALPTGQHQYAFVVDGQRWVTDPAAPAVDDGFGRRNSVLSVTKAAGRIL